jgi:hypothetical protein
MRPAKTVRNPQNQEYAGPVAHSASTSDSGITELRTEPTAARTLRRRTPRRRDPSRNLQDFQPITEVTGLSNRVLTASLVSPTAFARAIIAVPFPLNARNSPPRGGNEMTDHIPDPSPWPDPEPDPDPTPDPRPEPVPYRGDPPVRIIDLPPNTPTPGIPVEHP